MKIILETSGGIANIQLRGEIDSEQLPPELRQKAERLLELKESEATMRAGGNPYMTDAMEYRITLIPDSGVDVWREILLRDGVSDDDVLETARQLQRELVRQRKGK